MTSENWQQLKTLFHGAVELEPAARAEFLAQACAGDADLHRRVEQLIASHEDAGLFLISPAVVDAGVITTEGPGQSAPEHPRVGQRIGPYEIIREIGHGGMGTVFLAVRADDQYRKQVAIKLVNRGMDTDIILRRFVMERQILANLEHPNIARLLEGGSTADGLPYFVMEYVDGQPIDQYCDTQRLNTAQRLELFREVCAALQYAHQSLVIHRDIKPSNILITAEGVPKLLDFGIAKLLSPDWASEPGEITASMVQLMTPAYASPEQLRGLPITTAGDVYSLGVVLYELLSGHHPYRSTSRVPEEMAQVILREEPEKPSTAVSRGQAQSRKNGYEEPAHPTGNTIEPSNKKNPQSTLLNPKSLRGDLDNIVLKSLRKEPQRRYASVQEFSEDLRRHLQGLPVTASPDTLAYRANKFIQRHTVSVMASVFTLLSLLAGITATTWQAHRANIERAKAERRFNESRKLSKYLMTDVYASLTVLPSAAKVQKDLTQNALRYLDSLAQEEADDVVLLGELASAYIKLGEVQGTSFRDSRAALQSFEKAVELQRKRLSLEPGDDEIKRALVFALFKANEVLLGTGKTAEHLQGKSEILGLQQEVLDAHPDSVVDMFSLAGSYQSRGELFENLKRRGEATGDYQNAFRLVTQAIALSKDTVKTPEDKINLSVKYVYLADLYGHFEDWKNAVASNRQACQIAEAVWRENPASNGAIRNTTSSHRSLAVALENVGDFQGALENYQYSLRVLTEAAANSPDPGEFRRGTALYTIRVGAALHKVGETAKAIAMVKLGLDIIRKLVVGEKYKAATVAYSFEAYQPASDFFISIGKREEAIAVYREWVQQYEKLSETIQREPDVVQWSAIIYGKLGDVQSGFNEQSKGISETNRSRFDEARRWYQKSLAALAELRELRGDSDSKDIQELIITTQEKLAQCENQLK
ncbi:MAG: protein kinase domain-containing protein [Pyrinomonadaceae bacterium]